MPILLARQWRILASDWRNFLILGGPPLIIAALVAWVCIPDPRDPPDSLLALFFGYLAALWFGCSNAAQAIVREIPIYRRERLIGVGAHAYLTSKYLFLFAITAAQSLLLYGCLRLVLTGMDGSPVLQIGGLLGIAFSAVGIGCAISAFARNIMQAVLIVPLILIPQILFSGQPVKVSSMRDSVYAVSSPMPTFAAQTVMDVSFFWGQELGGKNSDAHFDSLHNLKRKGRLEQDELANGKKFTNSTLALGAFLTQLIWGAATYLIAWLGLRMQERK